MAKLAISLKAVTFEKLLGARPAAPGTPAG